MARYGFLIRLALSLLPLLGSERTRRVALGFLIRELRGDPLRVYDPLLNRLTPAFGAALAELQGLLARLGPAYGALLGGRVEAERRLELSLLRSTLRGFGLELSALSFEGIREELAQGGPVSMDEVDELFRRRMELFSDQKFRDCAEGLGQNRRLVDLGAFDFSSLLAAFPQRAPGRLGPARAEPLHERLHDLYFLLEGLEPSDKTGRVLSHILSEAGVEEDAPALLGALRRLLSGPLESRRLAKIIRCARGEPEFELRSGRAELGCLPAFVRELQDSYAGAKRVYLEGEARRAFEAKMKGLFGDLGLVPLDGYSEANGRRLAEAGLPAFRYVLPLQILRSFFALHFSSLVMPAVGELSIEADITDRAFKVALGDSVEAVAAMGEAIAGFDQRVASLYLAELGPMLEREKREGQDRSGRLRARQLLERADEEADRLVQSSFSRLGALRAVLARLAGDLREKSPALVLNAHFLLSQRPELVRGLLKAGQAVEGLLGVLRNFAVDLEAAKKGLDKRAGEGPGAD